MSIDRDGLIREEIDYNYVTRAYASSVRQFGGNPVHICTNLEPDAVFDICDALIISGGEDISPSLYGEAENVELSLESPERVSWDLKVLKIARERKTPVLGICYGMQIINVFLGGTLFQDIEAELEGAMQHDGDADYRHDIIIDECSTLFDWLGPRANVNSIHHQSVKELGGGLNATARSSDGVIEAIEGGDFVGIEWHPERDETRESIYKGFISMVKRDGND